MKIGFLYGKEDLPRQHVERKEANWDESSAREFTQRIVLNSEKQIILNTRRCM